MPRNKPWPKVEYTCKGCGTAFLKRKVKSAVSYCHSCRTKKNKIKKYNISLETYTGLLKSQDFKCKICAQEVIHTREITKRHSTVFSNTAVVDHCHSSNEVRGILCSDCNLGLGKFKDNKENLLNALKYLEEN